MRKIGTFLKKAAGWVLTLLGGLMAFESIFLVPAALLGKLDGSYAENLMMAVTFVFVGAAGVFLLRQGRRLCARKTEPAAPAATEAPAPATSHSDEMKAQPAQNRKAPEQSPPTAGKILLEQTWGGRAEHGEVQIILRPLAQGWDVRIRATEYDAANNPATREENFTLDAGYFQTRDAGEVQALFAAKSGGIRFSQAELCEKIPGLKPALSGAPLPDGIPPLEQAVETGNVGIGTREQHMDSHGVIYISMNGTPGVKYYWFEDGTLLFAGKGATRTVEMGGHDGRHAYEPESPPWSERVCKETRRAVFTEGITCVGSGLLQSLQNLEVLELADSVKSVEYNQIRKVHILRAGKHFESFNGSTGPLTELSLPGGPVHFQYHNSGSLPGVTGATPGIQKILDDHLVREFWATMDALFRGCPEVAKKLRSLASMNRTFAAGTISSLNWNSKYRSTRYVPEEDLWALHGLPKHSPKGEKTISIELKWSYGLHSFVLLAALAHAAIAAKPRQLKCTMSSPGVELATLAQWWRREFPDIALRLTTSSGETITVETSAPLNDRPTRQEMQAVKKTLSEEQSQRMHERFYQYTQDVQRGGMDPEIAAANRGLVFLDGQVADPELLEIAKRRRAETGPDPYLRASRPYEVAGHGRVSLLGEEQKYLLFLSDAKLAEKLSWGQSEYFAVDTRSMTPYYILEQYDGAAVAQSWYEIKEPVTWEELERYADPAQKYILGHEKDSKWSKQLAAFHQRKGDRLTQRWRRFRGGVREAALILDAEGYTLTYPDPAGKIKSLKMPREELKEALLREKTGLPDFICKTLSKEGRYLRTPKK